MRVAVMRTWKLGAAVAGAAGSVVLAAVPSYAADPPAGWTNERLLNCDGVAVLTYLTPAGFGTPFHVVGSEDVITPVHVEVIFPGETERVTTLQVSGFDHNGLATVHCTYTDPAGLFVDFLGHRT